MKKYIINHNDAAMIFKHLDEIPYKYAKNIVMILEQSLQPMEEQDVSKQETQEGSKENKEVCKDQSR